MQDAYYLLVAGLFIKLSLLLGRARRYLGWLQRGMEPAEAYTERAAVHAGAKCYLQAREDARAAIAALQAELRQQAQQAQQSSQQQQSSKPQGQAQAGSGGSGGGAAEADADARTRLALAYRRLGEAFLAEKGHEDRDCRAAAKAFMRAAEVEGEGGKGGASEGVQQALQEASEELSLEELNQVKWVGLGVGCWVDWFCGWVSRCLAALAEGKRAQCVGRWFSGRWSPLHRAGPGGRHSLLPQLPLP